MGSPLGTHVHVMKGVGQKPCPESWGLGVEGPGALGSVGCVLLIRVLGPSNLHVHPPHFLNSKVPCALDGVATSAVGKDGPADKHAGDTF